MQKAASNFRRVEVSPFHLDFTTVKSGDGATANLHLLSPHPFRGGEKVKVQGQGDRARNSQQVGGEPANAQKTARSWGMQKLVAVNEDGLRIGEGHGRARLTDADVALVVGLIEARRELIESCQENRMPWIEIARLLGVRQLSFHHIALKFEMSETHVRDIASGRRRCQVAARWKRVEERAAEGALGEISAG